MILTNEFLSTGVDDDGRCTVVAHEVKAINAFQTPGKDPSEHNKRNMGGKDLETLGVVLIVSNCGKNHKREVCYN